MLMLSVYFLVPGILLAYSNIEYNYQEKRFIIFSLMKPNINYYIKE